MDFKSELEAFTRNPDLKKPFTLPDGKKIMVGDVMIRTPELLFNPSLNGMDIGGIHKLIN